MWDDTWHDDHWPHSAPTGRRRFTHASRKQRAEASKTREPYLHTDVSHRMLAQGQQMPGELDPRRLTELMWRGAEDGFELPDEMKRRDIDLARKLSDRERSVTRFEQQITSPAQTTESFVSQEHVVSVAKDS